MRSIFLCICIPALAWAALGQEFEAVSVKPDKSVSKGSHVRSDRGMMTANMSLRSLIVMAYGMSDRLVEGPEWLESQRFDIAAKFPETLPSNPKKYDEALQAMLQKMLLDRFKLAVHRETRMSLVYALVVTTSGIKFKAVPDTDPSSESHGNHYTGTVDMGSFAEFLSRRMDLPVLDMTGLKGTYDLELKWVPEPEPAAPKTGAAGSPDRPAGPTIPVAIQEQLGLKLENRKAPLGILIVDHAEKVPTEN